uniref:Uncharacterized protein n=1 Tax=Solanum lycopersicum TaxID=4081 RepID=A0A3Q7HXC8_SOLLC
MDSNGVVSFHHRRSPSSDRFLGVFSPPQSDSAIGDADVSIADDELNEDEVFWIGDFTEPKRRSTSPSSISSRKTFLQPEKFGILAALPEDHRKLNRPVVYRKPSITSSPTSTKLFHSPPVASAMAFSRGFPTIPKPPLDREHSYNRNYSQTMPVRKFQHSVPVNVPMMPKKAPRSDLADAWEEHSKGEIFVEFAMLFSAKQFIRNIRTRKAKISDQADSVPSIRPREKEILKSGRFLIPLQLG